MSFRQFGGRQALSVANNIHTNALTALKIITDTLLADDISCGNIDISENAHIYGDLTVSGDALFQSDVDICGVVVIDQTLTVSGDALFQSDVDICGDVVIDQTLTVSGDVFFIDISCENIDISNIARIYGHLGVNVDFPGADVDISGNVDISGDLNISGDLDISGNVDINGNVDISGDVDISGNVDISGDVGIRTSAPTAVLDVSGNARVRDILTVDKDIWVGNEGGRLTTDLGDFYIEGGNIALGNSGKVKITDWFDNPRNPTMTVDTSNQRVGIGTETPVEVLDVSGVMRVKTLDSTGALRLLTRGTPDIYMGFDDAATDLYSYTINANIGNTVGTNFGMNIHGRITPGGAFDTGNPSLEIFDSIATSGSTVLDGSGGIRTPNLVVKHNAKIDGSLNVVGNVDISGELTVDGLIDPTGLVLTAQASNPAPAGNTIWTDTGNNMRYDFGAGFGLTFDPSVNGPLVEVDNTAKEFIVKTDGGAWTIQTVSNGDIHLCQDAGNVGIGTTTPTTRLEVNGDISCGGTLYTSALGIDSLDLYNTTSDYALDISGTGTGADVRIKRTNAGAVTLLIENDTVQPPPAQDNKANIILESRLEGIPGTPATIIPGTPTTIIPGIGALPDITIPGTPDTIIPGIPAIPAYPFYGKISTGYLSGAGYGLSLTCGLNSTITSADVGVYMTPYEVDISGTLNTNQIITTNGTTTIGTTDPYGNLPYNIYRPTGSPLIPVTQRYYITSSNRGSGALILDASYASATGVTFAIFVSYQNMPYYSHINYKIILYYSGDTGFNPSVSCSFSTFKDDVFGIVNNCILNGGSRTSKRNQFAQSFTTNSTFFRILHMDMFRGGSVDEDYMVISFSPGL